MMRFTYDPVLGLVYDFQEVISMSFELVSLFDYHSFVDFFREKGVCVIDSGEYNGMINNIHSIYCNGVECRIPLEIELKTPFERIAITREEINEAMDSLMDDDLLKQQGNPKLDSLRDEFDLTI